MKKIVCILLLLCSVMACRKADNSGKENIREILQKNLSVADFSEIDFGTLTQTLSASHQQLARVGFRQKDPLRDFVILNLNSTGQLLDSKVIHIEGSITQTPVNGKAVFNGTIQTSSLNGENKTSSVIQGGYILSAHESQIILNGVRTNSECSDCTIPEVVVSTRYKSATTFDMGAWLSLSWLFNGWSENEYIAIDYGSGGGGGGGGATITIDTEEPEDKERINTKKYTDCFGSVPDNGATCSITISADLPVDGHPETFFNWTDRSPGHAYIQLNKSTPYGTVQQSIGFYPGTSYKVLSGQDIDSKIIDDGGHEYNAGYTITVTPAQFQAALDAVNANASHAYNVSYYNCTDFALAVFNAAGGNLSIPRHPIPNFGVPGGSNTPQGLYEKISELKENGTAGTTTTNNKEYSGNSKGPCN